MLVIMAVEGEGAIAQFFWHRVVYSKQLFPWIIDYLSIIIHRNILKWRNFLTKAAQCEREKKEKVQLCIFSQGKTDGSFIDERVVYDSVELIIR